MKTYIKANKIILSNQVVENAYLEISQGKFNGIHQTIPEDAHYLDGGSYTLAPGLVDTHIHGFMGSDVMDGDSEGLRKISEGLLSCGVTSWLPTTLTDSTDRLDHVCQLIGDHYHSMSGAKMQGIFLEGPFFTEKYKGAQNPKYMMDPSINQLQKWNEMSGNRVKKIAIAPEREGTEAFIKYALDQNIKVGLAHSNATYQEAKAAVEAGADIFIHTFNGMSGLHHREPGMVGSALSLDNVYAEVICDGFHVHPAAAKIILKARGIDETVLISDCMRAGGLGDGKSSLGEFEVEVKKGAARLVSNGSLAGSVLTLMASVRNLVEWRIATLEEAVTMASLTPAKSVGIDNLCGKIEKGLAADFIVLDDQLNLIGTFIDGQQKYGAKLKEEII